MTGQMILKNQRRTKMEKRGIVKFISPKTFGVILEGEDKKWYNPAKGLPVDLRLKGQQVILEMLNDHTFKSIELDKEKLAPNTSAKIVSFSSTDRRELLIIRQVAAKCASEMTDSGTDWKVIAEGIESWILR
jgi:hypothetical protein